MSSKNNNLNNTMVDKSNIKITKDVDHDQIYERLYYNNLNQCEGDANQTYVVVKLIFSAKYKTIKPPTLNNVWEKNIFIMKKVLVKKKINERKIIEII